MIPYPRINPDIIHVGPIAVRWYGMMYLFGFAASFFLLRYQVKKLSSHTIQAKQPQQYSGCSSLSLEYIDALYSSIIPGLIIGARLGYVLFYNLPYYLRNPLEIFTVWHGGMSFHGGLIGSIVAGFLFCRKYRICFWRTADLIIVTAPIGLAFGRLGNFINGELYGRVTDVPWAMIFPSGGPLPRHPSQLYEFFLEGVVLFIILWVARNRVKHDGNLTLIFVVFYGLFRFLAEFTREPDQQVGFIIGMVTMGQLLSLSMILIALGTLYIRGRR